MRSAGPACMRCCRRPPRCPLMTSALFYHYLPDVAIAQLMFLLGLTAVVLGALGLAAGGRHRAAAAPRGRRASASPAWPRPGPLSGWPARLGRRPAANVIPALHDAANDRLIAYTPVCGQAAGCRSACTRPTGLPARRDGRPGARAPRERLAAGRAGPGGPGRRGDLIPSNDAAIAGVPPVFRLLRAGTPDGPRSGRHQHVQELSAVHLVTLFVVGADGFVFMGPRAAPRPSRPSTRPAREGGHGHSDGTADPGTAHAKAEQIAAAVRRFAALPAAARHAWLAAHLAALRAGHITLAQLP